MEKLLEKMRLNNIQFSLKGNDLEIRYRGKLPEDIIDGLKQNKEELVRYLQNTYEHQAKSVQTGKREDSRSKEYSPSFNQLSFLQNLHLGEDRIVKVFQYENVKTEILQESFKQLAKRHESFRTVFQKTRGVFKQVIIPIEDLHFQIEEIFIDQALQSHHIIDFHVRNEWKRIYNLSEGPLFFVKIIRSVDSADQIILTMHHLIYDGHSIGIIESDLMQLYSAISNGRIPQLRPLPFNYLDYTLWQHNFVDSEEGRKHKAYWIKKLESVLPTIKLPYKKGTQMSENGFINSYNIAVMEEQYKEYVNFCNAQSVTLPALFMSALILLLNRISHQKDITVFSANSARFSTQYGNSHMEDIVGFLVNTLMIRNTVDEFKSIGAFLKGVYENYLEDLEYRIYPFVKLTDDLAISEKLMEHNNLVVFNFHNYDYLSNNDHKVNMPVTPVPYMRAGFGVIITQFKNSLQIGFIMKDGLQQAPDYYINEYVTILKKMITEPESVIQGLKMDK